METGNDPRRSPVATSAEAYADASRKRKYSTLNEAPAREYGVMRDSGQHDTARFVGSASGIHFIRNVYHRLSKTSSARGDASRGLDHLVPGEDDQINLGQTPQNGEPPRLWSLNEAGTETEADEQPPTFEKLIAWSQSYFELWHPILPFLNAKEILNLFDKISVSGINSLSHLERSMIRSVLSISLADTRQSAPFAEPLPPSLVFQSIEEAISASHFTLYQPASLHATQAALSIQLFLISMLRLNAASRLGGLLVRMSFHLGLHRCPSRYPFFTPDEASMRRRVFWSLYCNERFLSQSLGLPLDIKDDDVDVCFPGEEKHSDIPPGGDSRLQLLTYLSRHAQIRGLILELRNKAASSNDRIPFDESYVRVELGRWSNEIQDTVEDDYSENGEEQAVGGSVPHLSPGHRLYLSMLQFEAQISLNRPMMAGGPSSASWSAGLQYCISAARSILSTLRRHQAHHRMSGENDARLSSPIIWPTVTWAIWISSFILIYAASEQQLPVASALRHIEAGKRSLHHVASRGTAWPGYCLSTIDAMTAALREVPSTERQQTSGHSHVQSRNRVPQTEFTKDIGPTTSQAHAAPSARFSIEGVTSPNASIPFSPTVAASNGLPGEGAQLTVDNNSERLGRPVSWPKAQAWCAHNNAGPGHVRQSPSSPDNWAYRQTRGANGPQQHNNRASQASHASQCRLQQLEGSLVEGQASFIRQEQDLSMREGEEPMIWYEQLFANSLGALDYPYMAAAQFDPSVDPTWSYLQ